ncbi:mycofactocin biosynthesis peptidyl-dipeptidase MftE [Cnuibacter physcomitrellae]|uniref:mycofactocin biosynthesis peptidyl-dipeptidase MftE n=1 Tax=Cnuibacter physcomitrellae TaxID=1619308 RepID=UPI002175DCCF|nr:mycofactocin biosynthesis peptidyl-dipeptidase MftE [Cnuibacter physcomitrellae]MCS5498807.1 mycofactocin biosynthesis peptidyl-dipeptidase MftE [Cnuibacter physcomitrellae]
MADLADLAWPEVPPAGLVLVPVGSTEQHGPHLPFTTDTVIAQAVAVELAERSGAVVAPPLAYGASGEHQSFRGTVSIGHEALASLVVELIRSLSTWAGRIVLVNGHGGNVQTLREVVPRMRRETHRVAWLPAGLPGGDAHAGRTETSLMLHLHPAAVRLDRLEPGATGHLAELLPALRSGGVAAVSPNGVLGDPRGSSAEEGADVFDAICASAVRRLHADVVGPDGCLADA